MDKTDPFINQYLEELDSQLNHLSKTQRENLIDEMREHLHSVVKEKRSQGLSDEEIKYRLQEEVVSSKDLANSVKNSKLKRYWFLVVPVFLFAIFLPVYNGIPISILFFILAYVVAKKKTLWGFAVVRKNAGLIKDQNKVAKLSSLYLSIIGLITLFGDLIPIQNKGLILTSIVISTVFFFAYVNNRQTKKRIKGGF
ncbi:HAAS signaling domain-containing protein [Melghirimyces algeriensis]|uniref:DUF1700 domain-containing protein n=1 Tax=Melghirimyces algeriensis TaxID=910412 RepID=A0A521DDU7_9BACL|nr:hypothetical protein [Melghirimyces algeriensis]SMO69859.1 hypothetical protein SAMN06264849_10611 [Melghirimyces algeriensis]